MAASTISSTTLVAAFLSLFHTVFAETTVSVTAPVNPVKENGILSLRCEVSDLQSDHEVRISRDTGNNTQTLSWNTLIAVDDNPRMFLAVRQLEDGSVVYFLTIIEATRSDEGLYNCRVFDPKSFTLVAEGTTPIKFQYFPPDPPTCFPESLPSILAGTMITLNCSSVGARPLIDISWSRTGDGRVSKSKITSTDTKVYSSISFKPSFSDNGAMFFCKVTSYAFPDRMHTCHIGPLKVLYNPYAEVDTDHTEEQYPTYPVQPVNTNQGSDSSNTLDNNDVREQSKCSEICKRNTSTVFYWIIGTFLAGFIALTFCIVAITVALRLHRAKRDVTLHRIHGHQTHQDIYLELDDKFDENRVYMALDQCRKGNANVCRPMLDVERNYTSTPIAPKGPIM